MYLSSQSRRIVGVRRGLTLIELVVVMVILAALAGILIPSLSGMITRAHTTSAATNAGEISKAIQTYQAQYLGYPNNLDSLVTDLGAGTMATTIAAGGTDLTTVQLTAASGMLDALNSAGITSVTMMSTTGATTGTFAWSPTFFPYADPTPGTTPAQTLLTASNKVAGLTGLAAAREFATPATATYAMFGIGKYSTLSKVMLEAPVHFDDDPTRTPLNSYCRYAAVFQLTDASGNALDSAKLVGVVGIHADQVSGIGDHLAEYWNTNK
jgi:prepilin-type N-terminal cleavage/methylation domain-containing protein